MVIARTGSFTSSRLCLDHSYHIFYHKYCMAVCTCIMDPLQMTAPEAFVVIHYAHGDQSSKQLIHMTDIECDIAEDFCCWLKTSYLGNFPSRKKGLLIPSFCITGFQECSVTATSVRAAGWSSFSKQKDQKSSKVSDTAGLLVIKPPKDNLILEWREIWNTIWCQRPVPV